MSGERILIVDDDRAIRELVGTLLRRRRFAVDFATDGEEGAALLSSNQYDVIVLDLMMPKLNGFDLIERLRREQPSILPHIVVMTAFSRGGRVPPLEGVHSVLRKPFDIDDLLTHIIDCAEESR